MELFKLNSGIPGEQDVFGEGVVGVDNVFEGLECKTDLGDNGAHPSCQLMLG